MAEFLFLRGKDTMVTFGCLSPAPSHFMVCEPLGPGRVRHSLWACCAVGHEATTVRGAEADAGLPAGMLRETLPYFYSSLTLLPSS